MRSHSCCQAGWRSLLAGKLGRCARCLRLSLLAALGSWTAVLGFHVLLSPSWTVILLGLLSAALGFSILLLAHVVAFVSHAVKLRKRAIVVTSAMGEGLHLGRGAFLKASVGALVAAAFLGRWERPAQAQARPQQQEDKICGDEFEGSKRFEPPERQKGVECASTKEQAENSFTSKAAQKVAEDICKKVITCKKSERCTAEEDCVLVTRWTALTGSSTCEEVGDCPHDKDKKLFKCEATLVRVDFKCACRCRKKEKGKEK